MCLTHLAKRAYLLKQKRITVDINDDGGDYDDYDKEIRLRLRDNRMS